MIMEHPSSIAVQPASQNCRQSTSSEDRTIMAQTMLVCQRCGNLTYIRGADSIENAMCPRCHGRLQESREGNVGIGNSTPIQSSCPQCQSVLYIPPALTGRHVFCIACGCRLLVTLTVQLDPAPRVRTEPPEKEPLASAAKTRADGEMIRVTCKCGKRLKAEPFAAGRAVDCPRCGLPVTFPEKPTADDVFNSANANCQPKMIDAGVPLTGTLQTPRCPPLPPHEAVVAARDHRIDAALYCLVHGTQPTNSRPDELREHHMPRFQDIAWLWPAAAAIAATCIVAILMNIFMASF